jgi:hypothetical protein
MPKFTGTLFTTAKKLKNNWAWWHMPVIPALRRLRKKDLEF